MSKQRVLHLLLILCFMSSPAALANEFPGWLQPYPLSTLENQSQRRVPDYQLPLSQITRIQGLLRTQDERRLSGMLMRRTWELAAGNTPEQGFEHMRRQLLAQNAEILFTCESRHCGASNLWANQVFGYANLLGVDGSQHYLAAQIPTGHMAVYAVRRGNGRVYLHVDYIHSAEMAAQVQLQNWQTQLQQQGYADLPGWQDQPAQSEAALSSWLAEDEGRQLRIVVHLSVSGGDAGLTEAKAEADALLERLIAQGVDPQRIDAYGVGALVPQVLEGRQRALTLIQLR